MRIKNLTGHDLHFFNEQGEQVLVVEPNGHPVRVSPVYEKLGETSQGIPLFKAKRTVVTNLPEYEPNTIIVVSKMTFDRIGKARHDVYRPHRQIKDRDYKTIGSIGLTR